MTNAPYTELSPGTQPGALSCVRSSAEDSGKPGPVGWHF